LPFDLLPNGLLDAPGPIVALIAPFPEPAPCFWSGVVGGGVLLAVAGGVDELLEESPPLQPTAAKASANTAV